MGTATSH